MNRWCFGVISGLALIAFAATAGVLAPGRPAQALDVRALEFTVLTPGGNAVELHFLVRAETADDAHSAALAATETLIPGATLDGADRASAAYAFWPWSWHPELLPVPIAYNPDGAPASVTEADIAAGIDPWNSVETSAFRIDYTGVTSARPGLHEDLLDGENVIGWIDLECPVGCVLGITTKSPAAYEVDIILNSNPAAGLDDGLGFGVDTATVVLHEIGHFAGLEHSCQPLSGGCTADEASAVMFPVYQGQARALGADDIAGISALYPRTPDADPAPPAEEAQYVLDLRDGWNLVVLPPGPLQDTVASLRCVDAVYTREGPEWRVWLRDGAPALNTLTTADGARSYWAHAEGSCAQTFTIAVSP